MDCFVYPMYHFTDSDEIRFHQTAGGSDFLLCRSKPRGICVCVWSTLKTQIPVFWVMTPYNLVYRSLKMKAVSFFPKRLYPTRLHSVITQKTTIRNVTATKSRNLTYCHMLVSRHGGWIDNWICFTLVTTNNYNADTKSTHFTNHYSLQ
jgi:hypothetical protein